MVTKNMIPELDDMYIMQDADRMQFAECSGLAYEGYPLFDWMFQERSDKDHSCDIWRANYAAFKSSVLAYSDSKDIRGTAVFVQPECQPVSIIKFLRYGLRTLWRDIPRIYRYSLLCERISLKYQAPNTWYLYDLAVKPEHQGKGIASRLLRPMLAYLDRIGANCYLETHDAKNVSMYEHFGFELVESPYMPNSELRHYAMLRKAERLK